MTTRPTDEPHNWTAGELRRERDRLFELIEQADYIQYLAGKVRDGDGELRAVAERRAWEAVPEHLRGGLARYLDEHIRTGSFLEAVLSNDLRECFARGDIKSRAGLNDIVFYLVNHAPLACWGSPRHFERWIEPQLPLLDLVTQKFGGELETDSEGTTLCPNCQNRHTLHRMGAEPGIVILAEDGNTKTAHDVSFIYCQRVHLIVLAIDGKELKR